MRGPTRVELSVSGLLNGSRFEAQGTLQVDARKGTKKGKVVYKPLPKAAAVGPDCTILKTGSCFIGARSVSPGRLLGPLDLLGGEFDSVRTTNLGRYGHVSVSETTTVRNGVVSSDLTTVGEVRTPAVLGLGPLRETIRVLKDGTLVAKGRYTLRLSRGRSIPVRYDHLYRSSRASARLFARWAGRVFELRAKISTRFHGRTLEYQSRSTLTHIR